MEEHKEFWEKRGKDHAKNIDPHESICCSGKSTSFNKICDYIQRKSMKKLIKGLSLENKDILEVGCGVGRWASFFPNSTNYHGIDIADNMVENAKKNNPNSIFKQSLGSLIPFDDDKFYLTYSVTVLQHMPSDQQVKTIKEMVRVTKKNGAIIIMEDILKRESPNSFMNAHEPLEWIEMFKTQGCKPIKIHYDKHFFFYSLSKRININEKLIYYLSLLDPYISNLLRAKFASGICICFQIN